MYHTTIVSENANLRRALAEIRNTLASTEPTFLQLFLPLSSTAMQAQATLTALRHDKQALTSSRTGNHLRTRFFQGCSESTTVQAA